MKNFYIFVLILFFANSAVAEASNLPQNIKQVLKHSVDVNYLHVLFALGIVILLIYITGIIYAKLNVLGQKTAKMQYKDIDDSRVTIKSVTPIGPNKNLIVIEISGKTLLIASTNESVNLIKDLTEEIKRSVKESGMSEKKELATEVSLDKIYPDENSKINDDIEIEDKRKIVESINDNPKYNTEDFGLYKKYL